MRTLGFTLIATLGLVGCKEDSGTAPSIENLTLDPDTIAPNMMETVTASFDFQDEDGDIDEAEVVLSGFGEELDLEADLTGGDGVEAGRGAVLIILQAPEEGELGVRLTVLDSKGNRSGPLEGTIDVALAAPPEACAPDECSPGLDAILLAD